MPSAPTIPLACTVRGCGLPLARGGPAFACAGGHAFDVARSGYLNLLQPQDRRSRQPGDAREAVLARTALRERGFGRALDAALLELAAHARLLAGSIAVDLGCGTGEHVASLARNLDLAAVGVDISVPAIEPAARAHPACTWVVANADRRLPLLDASVDVVLSVDGRRNADEIARVLKPAGHVLIAVPAPDDLHELRAVCLADARPLPGLERVLGELGGRFELVERRSARETLDLDRAGLAALAAATYRVARTRERERLAALDRLAVTSSHDVGLFRPLPRAA